MKFSLFRNLDFAYLAGYLWKYIQFRIENITLNAYFGFTGPKKKKGRKSIFILNESHIKWAWAITMPLIN